MMLPHLVWVQQLWSRSNIWIVHVELAPREIGRMAVPPYDGWRE